MYECGDCGVLRKSQYKLILSIQYIDGPVGAVVMPLPSAPEVVGSIPTRDKYLYDEYLYLFRVWI